MFYVSYTDIYLDEFDEKLGVYPKVEMIVDEDGNYGVKKLSKGVSKKPKNREICTMEELIAKFGGNLCAKEPSDEEPKESKQVKPTGKAESVKQ